MKDIEMSRHDFKKQNLVGDKHGRDYYKYSFCTCTGYRKGLLPIVQVTVVMSKIAATCTYNPNIKRPKKVLVNTMRYIGIIEGVHDVVECPEEDKGMYDHDVWIYSEQRKEAVRLLPHEIIDSEY